jgi:hypothetical protein
MKKRTSRRTNKRTNGGQTKGKQRATNKNDKKEKNDKKKKNIYGEYKNVLLTDKEFKTLQDEYSNYEELIKYLDEYIEMKGYKAKSHYLCIKKWVLGAVNKLNNTNKQNTNKQNILKKFEEEIKDED